MRVRRRSSLYFDHHRYTRVSAVTGNLALIARAATMPTGRVFRHPELVRLRTRLCQHDHAVAGAYTAARTAGAVAAGWSLLRGRPPSALSVGALVVAESLLARGVRGFAPYYDHLYLMAVLPPRTPAPRSDLRPPISALVPHAIYLSSAVVKLTGAGAHDWTQDGRIVENAIDLYGRAPLSPWLRRMPPRWISRAVLAFEVLAAPAAAAGLSTLRVSSLLSVVFHAVNAMTMRISFWHLGIFHIPVLVSIRRRRTP